MITETANIAGVDWTITGDEHPNPLVDSIGISATIATVSLGINVQYRQIWTADHTDDCSGITYAADQNLCSCVPDLGDRSALLDACRKVLVACQVARRGASEAERQARRVAPAAHPGQVMVRRDFDCPDGMYGVCTCC